MLSAVFVVGVAAGGHAAVSGTAVVAAVTAPALYAMWRAAHGHAGFDVVVSLALVAGALTGAEAALPQGPDHVAQLGDGTHALIGRVAAVLDGRRFVIDVEAVRGTPAVRRGRVEIRVAGRGRTAEPTRVYAARPGALSIGDRVFVEGAYFGDASDPRRTRRHGGERTRLDVHGTVSASSLDARPGRRASPHAARLAYEARNALDAANHRHLPPPLADALSGLVLGVDVADPELRRAFRDAGLMHALVASGAQLGIAAGLLHLALRRTNRWLHAGATLGGVWSFAMLAGFEPSMARAFVMAAIALAATALRRGGDSGTTLALSAAVLVASRPRLLADLGFQLSFAATAGLIYGTPAFARWIDERIPWLSAPAARGAGGRRGLADRGRRFLREAVAATLGANAAVLPILIWSFEQVQTLSLVSNVLAVPAVVAIVPLGFAASLAGVATPGIAPLLYAPAGWICAYLIAVARLVAALPLAVLPVPGWAIVPIGGAALLLWARASERGRGVPAAIGRQLAAATAATRAIPSTRWMLGALAVAASLLWIQIGLEAARPPVATLTMIDVGQGDSLLFESPGGRAVLIDAGPDPESLAGWLRARGRTRIDLLLLSHPHADHVTGLTAIVDRFTIGAVLDPGYPHPTPAYRDFLRAVENRGVPYHRARHAASFEAVDGVRARLLWPPPAFVAGGSPPNENSSVVRITFGRQAMLLTGDIERVAEAELVASGEDLTAHTLKIPHQGSATSSSEAFLRAVRPRIGLLSVGRNNEYGHPHRDVLTRYRQLGVRVFRTDLDGTIRVRTDGESVWVDTAKARQVADDR